LHAQAVADFTMNKISGCSPLSVGFTNLSTGSSSATYAWDLGNGNTSILKHPSAIYLEEKTYNITLKVTDGNQTSTKTKTITVYKKPVVDFTAAKPKVCLPEGVQFASSSTPGDGFISSYQWDFGDGLTQQGFGNSIFHSYQYEIVPAVSLTITNSNGCVASATKTNIVEVLPKIEPLFTVNKNMLCSLTDTIKLTNNSTGPGTLHYLWDFGDGNTSTVKNPVHRYTQKGVYQIRLTVSNTVGCSVTSSSISVNAAYFQTNFSSSPLCREVKFTGSGFLFPTSSLWQFGDGITSGSYANTTHTYASAGSYDVVLINTYNNTCHDTITKTVTVQSLTSFSSNITMPATACRNSTVNFSSTSTMPPNTINWNFGDGSSFTTSSTNISHIYTQPGTYTVTMVNTFGTCNETITKTIVVNDLPSTTGFVADFGGVCGAPVTVTFRDTTPGAVAWQWYMDWTFGTPFASTQNAPYTFTSDGFRTIYLTVTNASGCTRTVSKQINIARPTANIFITQSSSPKGYYDCDSLTIKLAANSNQSIQSYSWNLGNGNTSTLASPQVRYSQVGIYPITLTYVTESGCTGTASFSARVYDKPDANFTYSIPCGNSLNLNFTDTSPFSDNWNWKFGDGATAFWINPNHAYADTGKYTVTFINSIGHCSDTIVKEVYANVLPSSVSIIKAETTCDGNRGTVTFDQRSLRCSGGTWDFGDGTIIPYDSSNHSIKHTYAATGSYQVKLTSSYGSCTYTDNRTVRILLKQNPVLTANATQLCANNSLNVQLSNLQSNPYSFGSTWDQYSLTKFEHNNGIPFNGFVSSSGFQNTNYSATLQNFTGGTTAIRAIIKEGFTNCLDTSNFVPLQVNGPIAGFRIVNNDGCYKSAMTFADTSRSPTNVALTSWRWDFGDGNFIINNTNAQVSHRYANPGSYIVRLTVTDATGCTTIVTQRANARGPKVAFTTSGLFVPNVPLNTTVNFFNNSFIFNSTVSYTWHYGDGTTSGNYNGTHTYTVAGTYTVMLIAADPSIPCADTAKQVITVKDFNTAFTYTKTFVSNNACPPVLIRINNLSVGFTRVMWDFGDGTTSTQLFPSHMYNAPGLYRITLYTYGFNGLSGTYVDSIIVSRPAAQLTADILQGCTSQQVTFGLTSENTVNYLWDLGDGNLSTASTSLTHPYLSPGIYSPRLIVKDSNNCQASTQLADSIIIDSLAITIKGIPPLVCDSALIQFAPEVASFAEVKLGATLQYKWDFGTGNPADTSSLKNPSFRYTIPGTYTVKFKVTSPYGCTKETAATFVVHQKASGSITAVSESCEQSAVQFIGVASQTTGVQWSWNFGNGTTSTLQNPAPQLYLTPGNYTVTLQLTKNGCVDTKTHHLTVHPKPIVQAQPKNSILCLGNSVAISASGGGSYLWLPATGLSNNTISNPVAAPVNSTQYRVQVTSGKGCVSIDSLNITVAKPIDVTVAGAADICHGMSNPLSASGASRYQWINNTVGLSNVAISNPVASPTVTSTYSIVGYDTYNCFTDTATITINVHDLPSVNAGPDVQIQGGIPHQLTVRTSNDVTGWLWSPGTHLDCVNCPSPMATPKMETEYVVKVNNQWGCVAMDTVVVKLNCAMGNVYISDAFTPNNDGKNDVFYIRGTGVKIIRYLRIYDRWGGLLYEKAAFGIDDRSSAWDGRVNGQPVATGTYVYVTELECSSGERFVRKGTVTLIR
jgi:gliding motility-associated-like protein